MTTTTIATTRRWNWRTIAYSIMAGPLALQNIFIGLIIIARSPWLPPNPNLPWITKWHSAESAMMVGVLTGVLLLATLWRPQQKGGLLQLLFWNFVITAPIIALLRIPYLGLELSSWVMFAVVALLFVLSPSRGQLFSLKGEGSASKPLLILTAAAALLLLPDLWRNVQWQVSGFGGDPAQRYFWLQTVFVLLTLMGGGILTAIKRPGWQVLGVLLGVVYLYLGVVAITLPNEVGSWGMVGGMLSMLGGAAYMALTVWETRRSTAAHPLEIR